MIKKKKKKTPKAQSWGLDKKEIPETNSFPNWGCLTFVSVIPPMRATMGWLYQGHHEEDCFYTLPSGMKVWMLCKSPAPEVGIPTLQREREKWSPFLDLYLLHANHLPLGSALHFHAFSPDPLSRKGLLSGHDLLCLSSPFFPFLYPPILLCFTLLSGQSLSHPALVWFLCPF
jgi:hypothetical protein